MKVLMAAIVLALVYAALTPPDASLDAQSILIDPTTVQPVQMQLCSPSGPQRPIIRRRGVMLYPHNSDTV